MAHESRRNVNGERTREASEAIRRMERRTLPFPPVSIARLSITGVGLTHQSRRVAQSSTRSSSALREPARIELVLAWASQFF